jgi:hypothetical protein
VGDFNTPVSPIDRSSKQKFNKEILEINDTINQMDLTGIYRIFHPTTTTQYTFFSAAHGTFFKKDHLLRQKTNFSKYKKIEIIPCILSNHNVLKLELKDNSNSRKSPCKSKMKRENTQISKIRKKKREITTNTIEIQEIIRNYF